MGLPLMVSFTSVPCFSRGASKWGLDPVFAWRAAVCSRSVCRFLGLPAWLSACLPAAQSGWSVLPHIENSPYVGQQTCPWENHPKTSLLTLSLQC